MRYLPGHYRREPWKDRPGVRERITAHFWSRVDRSAGDGACWPWQGCTLHGYGVVQFFGERWQAHRLAWTLTNGPIPDGIEVLHKCDHHPCCNPSDLFLGTQADNMHDMIAKGRSNHEGKARGSRHGRAKLTEDKVLSIRERYAKRDVRMLDLADEYGMSKSTIGRIISGKYWPHVQ